MIQRGTDRAALRNGRAEAMDESRPDHENETNSISFTEASEGPKASDVLMCPPVKPSGSREYIAKPGEN